jgi:hypothetical protein
VIDDTITEYFEVLRLSLGRRIGILLVDGQHQRPVGLFSSDDKSFLVALSRLLRAANYRVETFDSAEEFLKSDRSEAAGIGVLLQAASLMPRGVETSPECEC